MRSGANRGHWSDSACYDCEICHLKRGRLTGPARRAEEPRLSWRGLTPNDRSPSPRLRGPGPVRARRRRGSRRQLVRELRLRGFLAELVSVPFKWYPKEEILPHAAAWRLLDLSESNGEPVDSLSHPSFRRTSRGTRTRSRGSSISIVPPTSFVAPSTATSPIRARCRPARQPDSARHRRCSVSAAVSSPMRGTRPGGSRSSTDFAPSPCIIRRSLHRRLTAGPMAITCSRSADRIGQTRRPSHQRDGFVDPPVRLIVAGDGTQRANARAGRETAGIAGRVTFLGSVGDDDLVGLYAGALAVVYPPFDEDFGYVTLEAFLARKPVVTCSDSGGPNEFVVDGVNGFVCAPRPEEAGLGDQSARCRSRPHGCDGRRRLRAWRGASPGTA